MDLGKLFALFPLIYIVWWIYTLFMSIAPWLNIAIDAVLSLTLLQIVLTILFFTAGLAGLIICIALFIAILIA